MTCAAEHSERPKRSLPKNDPNDDGQGDDVDENAAAANNGERCSSKTMARLDCFLRKHGSTMLLQSHRRSNLRNESSVYWRDGFELLACG